VNIMSLDALEKSLAKQLGLGADTTQTDLTGQHAAKQSARHKAEAELADRAARGKQFLAAFGQQGAVWFAEGKTFAEAERLWHALNGSDGDALRNAGLTAGQSRFAAAIKSQLAGK
jgi:hypothetical protein